MLFSATPESQNKDTNASTAPEISVGDIRKMQETSGLNLLRLVSEIEDITRLLSPDRNDIVLCNIITLSQKVRSMLYPRHAWSFLESYKHVFEDDLEAYEKLYATCSNGQTSRDRCICLIRDELMKRVDVSRLHRMYREVQPSDRLLLLLIIQSIDTQFAEQWTAVDLEKSENTISICPDAEVQFVSFLRGVHTFQKDGCLRAICDDTGRPVLLEKVGR